MDMLLTWMAGGHQSPLTSATELFTGGTPAAMPEMSWQAPSEGSDYLSARAMRKRQRQVREALRWMICRHRFSGSNHGPAAKLGL